MNYVHHAEFDRENEVRFDDINEKTMLGSLSALILISSSLIKTSIL